MYIKTLYALNKLRPNVKGINRVQRDLKDCWGQAKFIALLKKHTT